MKTRFPDFIRLGASFALALGLAAAPAVHAGDGGYRQRNLVSDGFAPAERTDANLVNAWGLAFNPFGVQWVSDHGTGLSTLYDGDGNPQSLVVQIPSPTADNGGKPTGIVFNGSGGFAISKANVSGPSRFVFATDQGVIAAWAPNVDLTHALRVVDQSAQGAIYKGLAISAAGQGGTLYAADFRNARVDVFDASFKPITLAAGAFRDPYLPPGYAPFGIQAIGGDIYVSYAKQNAQRTNEVRGPGLGFVNAYTPAGRLIRRVASRGALNAPWGMVQAPVGFGRFGNALLIGNVGDGRINAYETSFGLPLGTLRDANRRPIQIEGLWGLAFGNGFANQPVDTLFFAAGSDQQRHGLYGRLDWED